MSLTDLYLCLTYIYIESVLISPAVTGLIMPIWCTKRFGPMLLWANRRGRLGGSRTEGRGQRGGQWTPHLHLVSWFKHPQTPVKGSTHRVLITCRWWFLASMRKLFPPHLYERAERGATARFYFVKLRGRNTGCSWSGNLFFVAPGEFANLSDCFIPAQRLWGTFFPVQLRGAKRGERSGNIHASFLDLRDCESPISKVRLLTCHRFNF